jgi:urease accessory protein
VQKPLYPEGEGVCHAIVVHPPAGIAGGDTLRLDVHAGNGAHAVLTTPGAAKWYRSAGAWARQRIAISAAAGACVEWLPQENIVFDRALAHNAVAVNLRGDAAFIGWDVLCLGRAGSGERFSSGVFQSGTRISRDGKPVWFENGRIEGAGTLRDSPAGLHGATVCATLLAASPRVSADLLAACRAVICGEGRAALTRLPGLLIARYLGHGSEGGENARRQFVQLWRVLRPALTGRDAVLPRIWST